MKKFRIAISSQAKEDILNLFNVITYHYKSFDTAKKYVIGLRTSIYKLATTAKSFQLQNGSFFLKYGTLVYRINYKKMAIIYTVHNDLVIIQRIIPASLITDL